MFNFIWAAVAIAFIPFVIRVLLLANMDVADIVYAMLSGSIVGLVVGTFALAKNVPTPRAVFLVFAGIMGGAAGWLLAWFLLRVVAIDVYSITALAVDLIVGVVGAVSLCFFLLGRYVGLADSER